jgi:TatD DNase family protein
MTELTDTHCHIQSAGREAGEKGTWELWAKVPGLTGDQLVADAVTAGVTRLLCVGCDLVDSRLAVDFVQKYANCWATVGIHPHESQHFAGQTENLKDFAALVTKPKVVAVGECGLDFYYQHSPPKAQVEILKFQIELALKHNLPLIFHVRDAFDDFWPVFDNYRGLRGVLHSFTDSAENLANALQRGLYIGMNGIATFAKNPAQLEVYKKIPLEKLLLETDAPFLTPVPYRGTINEPKRVCSVAEFIAELRAESRDELATTTTHNARQLFGI